MAEGTPVVLYIEDNVSNRKVMEHIFRSVDAQLIEAVDGESGLAAARAERPDLILLDMQLPGTSGYEVAEELKADERTCQIPVVAVTSNAMSGDDELTRQAGCDDYLAKPFRPPQLLEVVRRHLR